MIRHLLHTLTHRHYQATKENVGVLLVCASRITGRWRAHWSFADGPDPDWQPFPPQMVDRLGLCTTRSQVAELLAGGRR